MSQTHSLIDLVYRGLLTGSWVNCILLSIEIVAASIYFAKHKPRGFRKWFVVGMLCNDIASSALVCVTSYLVRLEYLPPLLSSTHVFLLVSARME